MREDSIPLLFIKTQSCTTNDKTMERRSGFVVSGRSTIRLGQGGGGYATKGIPYLSNGRTIGLREDNHTDGGQYEQYYHLILDLGYLYQYPVSILNIGLGL